MSISSLILRNLPKSNPDDIFSLPGTIVVSVTTRCNFNCQHCMREQVGNKDLPLEIIAKLTASAKKYKFKNFSLTGGEPLMYPHFKEAVELITKDGSYNFNFATNGYLFEKNLEFLVAHKKNLQSIVFSMESIHKEKHDKQRHSGSYDLLLKDFEACRRLKLPFQIITCLIPQNVDEVFEIALFAKKKGAGSVRFTTAMPCPNTQSHGLILDEQQRKMLLPQLMAIAKVLKFPVVVTSAIKTSSNIALCAPLSLAQLGIDVDANLVQCCDLANHGFERVRKNAVITSLKDKTFDEALRAASEYMHRFMCMRIEDYGKQRDIENLDFNSCFYCIHKLSATS